MNMGAQVVAQARAWIGTPYLHQASCKGAGTDCLGLLRGIWREIHGAEPRLVPAYTADWAEPSGEEALVFRMRDGAIAKHLGIAGRIGSDASFIHAYTGHGVVESPLSAPWQRKIAARFRFPEGV
jgi:cell wall-associated NlpC family hydrolase